MPAGRRFRFGVLRGITDGCEDAVRENFARSLEVLRGLGTVEEVALPDLPYDDITRTILFAEAASAFEDLIESGAIAGLTAPEDRYTAYARDAILAKDYLKALRLRGVMAREADRVLASLDALVAPGRSTVAAMLGGEVRSAIRGTARDVMGAVGNGAGLPAVAVPNGFGARGLPTSLQFMGRAWEENTILAAARAYQAAHRLASAAPRRRLDRPVPVGLLRVRRAVAALALVLRRLVAGLLVVLARRLDGGGVTRLVGLAKLLARGLDVLPLVLHVLVTLHGQRGDSAHDQGGARGAHGPADQRPHHLAPPGNVEVGVRATMTEDSAMRLPGWKYLN